MSRSLSRPSVLRILALITYLCCFVILMAPPSTGQTNVQDGLAERVIKTCVAVQPGDVVVLYGGRHHLDMMEELAMHADKSGGLTNIMVLSDKLQRAYWTEVPEEYLSIVPSYWKSWLSEVDVWIGMPAVEDPRSVYADIPQERFAAAAEASQMFTDILNGTPLRFVFINPPSTQQAATAGMGFDRFSKMRWSAINADYSAISKKGYALADVLHGAKEVHITSPAGTDIRFSMGDREVFVNDGIVTEEEAKAGKFVQRIANLPGGQVFASTIEKSVTGRVVIPKGQCNWGTVRNVSFEFRDGDMHGFEAEEGGDCIAETLDPYEGPTRRFASFSIGLNSYLEVDEESATFWPANGAGMVYINVGDNQLLGGKNVTQAGYGFPITRATVIVDGVTIVKDGKLTEVK
ncbi:MAG: aminopeptidase [Candidatus Krumholzibacteria bacterium]|nr:aminopeptidase [Candidatus Krumholzibacteria bacterium]